MASSSHLLPLLYSVLSPELVAIELQVHGNTLTLINCMFQYTPLGYLKYMLLK